MGLTTWQNQNGKKMKSDVIVAKNYLPENKKNYKIL